ncbi:proteinase inhibitor type-2 CEVI57-like [Ipomoea triloba]|uniref:proteinase inhibitor type-2 CEVI57-like n=1 Tax=Ipomoea triloba TaxID=35885 RepID=UPI00125D1DE4|nr:proteinase inhibitor type-2 CEVI57-like [Ipomoea triloba]GMD53068.1 proteinase inhibitor PSI-1.2-like [Ipomoea batatas]
MATTSKLGLVTLLLCGIIVVVGSQMKHANAQEKERCLKDCDVQAKYMICPATSVISEVNCTNCCVANNDGCILYNHNGTALCPKEPCTIAPN